eukprot:3838375-Pleurochrysis_carterae.AAC.2
MRTTIALEVTRHEDDGCVWTEDNHRLRRQPVTEACHAKVGITQIRTQLPTHQKTTQDHIKKQNQEPGPRRPSQQIMSADGQVQDNGQNWAEARGDARLPSMLRVEPPRTEREHAHRRRQRQRQDFVERACDPRAGCDVAGKAGRAGMQGASRLHDALGERERTAGPAEANPPVSLALVLECRTESNAQEVNNKRATFGQTRNYL